MRKSDFIRLVAGAWFGVCLVGAVARSAEPATEEELELQVRDQLKAKDLAGAQRSFDAAVKQFPQAARIQELHEPLYFAYSRAGQLLPAAEHLAGLSEHQAAVAAASQRWAQNASAVVGAMLSTYRRAGQPETGFAKLNQVLVAFEKAAKESTSAQAAPTLAELHAHKIEFLAESNRLPEARRLLDERLRDARQQLVAQADQLPLILAVATLLKTEVQLAAEGQPEQEVDTVKRYLAFLAEQLQGRAGDPVSIDALVGGHITAANLLLANHPAEAEKIVGELREFLNHADTSKTAVRQRVDASKRTLAAFGRRIETAKTHLALIGKPAISLDVESWVNGSALSDPDLKGKVVLLDFWAVWCGPCIATFPKLREWQAKYAEQGLVILGITSYYGYGWDADARRPEQRENVAAAEEQEMLQHFAERHELKHRFAVTPKRSTFSAKYAVSGIPQAVLLDRQGNVRLVRVGSSDRNVRQLEATIQKLLAE